MVFFTTVFIVSWLCFWIFANKKKFFQFLPSCYIAIILAYTADFIADKYPSLWHYPASTTLQRISIELSDDYGVYPVVVYLFIQWLPKTQNIWSMFRYILLWTTFCILLEYIAVKIGSEVYGPLWNIGKSYVADWILFLFFYSHYKWWRKNRAVKEE
jgi:hypothetical protein